LAIGSDSITAVYAGDANFTGSESSAYSQTVLQSPTITAIGTDYNPTVYGQAMTVRATVSPNTPGLATPSGEVDFYSGNTLLGTGTLDTNGVATYTTARLAPGQYAISATYVGDADNSSSQSPSLTQTVGPSATTLALAPNSNTVAVGQPLILTAGVGASAPGAGIPAGTVTFLDGTTTLGTQNLSSGGATFTTSTLSAGMHSITAVYNGDANFTASTATISVSITSAASNFATLSGGVLTFNGPAGDNTLALTTSGSHLIATLNGVNSRFRLASIASINLNGGAGNDTITIGSGVPGSTVLGGTGNDTITASNFLGDSIKGGSGTDSLRGGGLGFDTIRGGSGNYDTIRGGADSNDSLRGGTGSHDSIRGGAGSDDIIRGGAGSYDSIRGGAGDNDTIIGGAGGGDTLTGGAGGNDSITASTGGDDSITGGSAGSNTINAFGSSARDTLIGGGGPNNTAYAGPGDQTPNNDIQNLLVSADPNA
jgi:Ca2+-binding RTX toxin-like protein